MKILAQIGCRHFMEGDDTREGRKNQKKIEEDRYKVPQEWHTAKCLMEDVGQCDEYEARTGIDTEISAEDCWKNDDTRHDSDNSIDDANLDRRADQVGILTEIGGKST